MTPRVEPDFDNVVGVSTSMFDTCAWRSDGTVACKLRGGKLQTIAKLDHVDEVVGDQRLSCARHAGRVSCWTIDDRKQPMERSPATEVAGIADAVQIAVAGGVACLRRATGDVSCWDPTATPGDDGKPPVFGTSPSPVLRAKGAVSLVGGGTRFAALLPDGTSYGWDWRAKPWTLPAGKLTRIVVGDAGVCVEAAGAFRCIEEWDKTSAWVDMPQIAGAVEIATEGGLGCARMPSSHLRCWGFVDRLGIGQALLQTKPVEVAGIDDATAIAGTDSYATCALHKTGRVSCWGTHLVGKLDTGNVDRTPVDVGLDHVTSIEMGMYTACAHTDDHKLRCWGQRDDNTSWDTPTIVAKHPRSVGHGEPNTWGGGWQRQHWSCKRKGNGVSCIEHFDGRHDDSSDDHDASFDSLTDVANLLIPGELDAPFVLHHNGDVEIQDGDWKPFLHDIAALVHVAPDEHSNSQECVLSRAGKVSCWQGPNIDKIADLGVGDGTQLVGTTQDGYTGRACVLRKTGHVACWGSREMLGDGHGNELPPTDVPGVL